MPLKSGSRADDHPAMSTSVSAATRNDMRYTPLDAFTLESIGRQRRAAFGHGTFLTGPPRTVDPVTGRPTGPIDQPGGVDLYL